jgi:hypothetical protein
VHGEVREKARHAYGQPSPAAVTRQLDPAVDLLMHHARLKLRKGGACMHVHGRGCDACRDGRACHASSASI